MKTANNLKFQQIRQDAKRAYQKKESVPLMQAPTRKKRKEDDTETKV